MTELLRARYEPIEVVGQGGEGRVLKAIDRQHDRVVALKVRTVFDDADRQALLAEARLLLDVPPHPNLPLVREDFFEGDEYVIAMDWIDGTDLSRLLQARGRPGLAPSSVLHWLADAASALTHLHTLDPPVVHGDVKPANLVLTRGGRVVLVDFGLSSSPDNQRTRGGTPGFAAPELAAGSRPSRATDVYSLAATAFALLTGEPPAGIRPTWDGIDRAQAALLEEAIRAGLSTDPARRPDTPGELIEQLRAGWESTLPTGVLTFCITDIEGSTPLWEERPADMAVALVRHDQLIAEAVERHGGRFLKAMGEGDSTTSVFTSPQPGVDAMIDVQRALADSGGAGIGMKVRAALHTGEAEQRDGAYFGTTLHLTARVRGLADGGQVFVSKATAALVQRTLPDGVTLVDLGPHRLKGISEPEQVYALSAPGVTAPPPGTACPYPGLPAFEAADADRFFGREAVVAELRAHLDETGFVAIVGASGSGKSSVLRAGLATQVEDGALVVTPGRHPQPLSDGTGLVIVDQFEEAFSLCDDAEVRTAFLDSVVGRRGPVAVGIRADFYGRCAEHLGLATAMAADQVLLGPLSPDELREAIVGPAEAFGLRVEPALVDVLVEEVAGEPGALPLLSHALRSTWERRDGRVLTLAAYRATGGLRAAIATTAEEVYGRLDPDAQELARRTFLALTEPGEGREDSRRWASLAELTPAGGTDRVEGLLDAMVAERLVSRDQGTVAVAHEALIREWPRLRGWLDEDREGLRLHRHLARAAAAWDGLGRDPGELYRGPRLAAATEWAERTDDLSTLEAEFLEAGRAEQERGERARARTTRRLRILLAGVGIALVGVLIAALIAVDQRRDASASRDHADVARIAAVSRSLVESQPDVGLLLAAEAYDLEDTADTRSTLLNAIETHPLLEGLIYGVDSGLEAAVFSPDGSLLATPTSDGTGTIVWNTATRQRQAVLDHGDDLSLDAAISPDGRTLAVPAIYEDDTGGGGRLEVWDLPSGTLRTVVDSPAGILTTAAFSPDGRRLVTQGGPATDRPPSDVVVVWDTATWEPVGEPWDLDPGYSGDEQLAVSPDGELAAMRSPDGGALGLFRIDDRTMVGAVDLASLGLSEEAPVTTLAFSPDSATLAVTTDGGSVAFVDPATGEAARDPLPLAESTGSALAWSPDGTMLAVGRLDGRTQMYDLDSDEPLGPPLAASAAAITDVAFSADGSRLATTSADRTGALWRLDGGRSIGVPLDGQDGPITEAAYSADGEVLATASADGTVAVRDARSGDVVQSVPVADEALSVAVSPDGSRLAAGGSPGVVVLADVDGGDRVDVPIDGTVVHQVAFAPDGATIAVAVARNDAEDARPSPEDGQVRFLDAASGDEVDDPIDVGQALLGAGFSPDGRTVVAITENNLLVFYDRATHRERGDRIENVDSPITSFAFSPDATRLVVGVSSGAVRQYDARTHHPVGAAFEGEHNPVYGVAWSPDGELIAASSLGFSTTRLWDASGTPVGEVLTGGRVPYTYRTFFLDHLLWSRPAFSPDGTHLVGPGFDGATVLWDLDPDHWRAAVCELAGRDLTPDEWARYLPGRDPEPVCPDG